MDFRRETNLESVNPYSRHHTSGSLLFEIDEEGGREQLTTATVTVDSDRQRHEKAT